jgi:hypothetical protein
MEWDGSGIVPTRMREIRSSGSVEGVMSDHDPYSDCDPTANQFDAGSKEVGYKK